MLWGRYEALGDALSLQIIWRGGVGGAAASAGTGVALAKDGGAGLATVVWGNAWLLREGAGVV